MPRTGDPELGAPERKQLEQAEGMQVTEQGESGARCTCPTCGAGFAYQRELEKHQRELHAASLAFPRTRSWPRVALLPTRRDDAPSREEAA